MNTSNLIILLVRFFAICLAINAINNIVYSGLLFTEPGVLSVGSIAIPASIMLAGILIWFMPYTLVKSLTGYKGSIEKGDEVISFEQFSAVAFLMLSLYLGYKIVGDGCYWLFYYLNYKKFGLTEIGLDYQAAIFGTLIEAIFFILMLLGRKKIFYYFKKLRS